MLGEDLGQVVQQAWAVRRRDRKTPGGAALVRLQFDIGDYGENACAARSGAPFFWSKLRLGAAWCLSQFCLEFMFDQAGIGTVVFVVGRQQHNKAVQRPSMPCGVYPRILHTQRPVVEVTAQRYK